MKVGLLTSIREDHYLPGESFLKRYMTNLAPMYLAAYLEKQGFPAEVFIKDRLEDLIPYRPDILGISSVTENFEHAKKLAARAKALWNPIVILGGVHITSLPGTLPESCDIGVTGEGEQTFHELLQCIRRRGGMPSPDELRGVSGIVFRQEGRVVQTMPRKDLPAMDDIPHPDRRKFIRKIGTAYMMTSRGCPYTCSFCVIPAVSEGYRKHSASYVVDEIKAIKQAFPEVRHIRIFDDLYIVGKRRAIEIAERVAAEGLNKDLSYACWGRANLLDKDLLKALRKMNMMYVAFGAESGSSEILGRIKPASTLDENQRAIDRLHDQGVHPSCSFILGHPQESESDLWSTYAFIERNMDKLLEIEFNVAIPWPGTALWKDALDRGIVSETMNFDVLKECAYFPNYSTDLYPYLNRHIAPERFEVILEEFKTLFSKMMKKIENLGVGHEVNPGKEIAALQ